MENPEEKLVDPEPIGPMPRRFHSAQGTEWEGFLKRKAEADMVVAVPLRCVPRAPNGALLWSGVFHVPKSSKEDRPIDDRRIKNWSERRWLGKKPAHAVHYTKSVLHPGRKRRYNVVDAPHFYHNLDAGLRHVPHAPTGPPMTRAKIRDLGIPIVAEWEKAEDEWFQPCGITVAMGDAKGVTLAQQAHLNMAKSVGLKEEWLTDWHMPEPRGPLRGSLCIDDLLIEEDVPMDMKETEDGEGDAFIAAMLELYDLLGIPPKQAKLQLKRDEVTSLGAAVSGLSGRVGVPLRTMAQIMMLTMAVVLGAPINKKGGQRLLGLWTFGLMFRREFFALVEKLYGLVDALPEKEGRGLAASGREEFLSLFLMAPLMRSVMRWGVSNVLFASDAEGSGGSALVSKTTTQEFAEEVFRYSQVKADYATMAGDAGEMKAMTALEEKVSEEVKAQRENQRKTHVEVKQLEIDEEEEPYAGQALGRQVVEGRLRRH